LFSPEGQLRAQTQLPSVGAKTVIISFINRKVVMQVPQHNLRVAKELQNQRLGSIVHDLFSPRLRLVILAQITRLPLRLVHGGGGRIGRRSIAGKLNLPGRVSIALKPILPSFMTHRATFSRTRKLMRGTSEQFDDGREPVWLHQRKRSQSRVIQDGCDAIYRYAWAPSAK
jgi:hypothetical protein